MGKRFTDTDKWKRPWFSELSSIAKLAWVYLLDDCDHRGVWAANFKRMSFDLGQKIDASKLESWFGDKLRKLDSDKYFICSFIEFQHPGGLNPNNNAHKSIISFIEKLAPPEPHQRGSDEAQDKDKDKDKVKDKDNKGGVGEKEIEAVYRELYPLKKGKTEGVRYIAKDLKENGGTLDDVRKAITKYRDEVAEAGTPPQFRKHFSTFAHHWRDWLDDDAGVASEPPVDWTKVWEKVDANA